MTCSRTLTVHVGPEARLITVGAGQQCELTEVLRHAGLPLNTRCGRRGLCDGCVVELLAGDVADIESGEGVSAAKSVSLKACRYQLADGLDAEIRVPARSLLAHEPQVVTSFRYNVTRAHEPMWQIFTVRWEELDGCLGVNEAIARAVAKQFGTALPIRAETGLAALRPNVSDETLLVEHRGDHWTVRAPVGIPAGKLYGVAVDVGTTTVVALLVDLDNGDVVATASALNAQTSLGDNVLTRITLCVTNPDMTRELQRSLTEKTLRPLIDQLLTDGGVSADRAVVICVAGNTTMLHLLAGVDPSSMGGAPFTPVFLDHRVLNSDDVGMTSCGGVDTAIHLLPGAAAYIGADITAGVFASGMAYRSDSCLLVDLGTNGEIVLAHADHLIGCATAAGPAFEGSGLACGVRAGRGAISHLDLDSRRLPLRVEVIGGGKPIGICGTGYVDFVAQARRCGFINQRGRITPAGYESGLVQEVRGGRGFLIARGRGHEPIVITEADIASFLQAKAAIAAGIDCLLARCQLTAPQVNTVFLAGGFGFHINLENLIGCGLLPAFQPGQIEIVGNTSLAGAYLSLLDAGSIEEIRRISVRLEIVELNLEKDFTSRYVDQLWLP